MKLNRLDDLVKQYDRRKGRGRHLFGDAKPIKALREFIKAKKQENIAATDMSFSINDFKIFAANNNFRITLDNSYLNSGCASADFFRQWLLEDIPLNIDPTYNLLSSELSSVNLTSITSSLQSDITPTNFDSLLEIPRVPVQPYNDPNAAALQRIIITHFIAANARDFFATNRHTYNDNNSNGNRANTEAHVRRCAPAA